MPRTPNLRPLVLPALRASTGDWVYYIAHMRMSDIAERVDLAEHIHQSDSLKRLLQRTVDESRHAAQIAQYIVHQPQRLFNALVIGVYGGMPEWGEIAIRRRPPGVEELPAHIEGSIGILTLNGAEDLFAIDGQHRVVGIRKALAEEPARGSEAVATIFVGHANDDAGMQRTRRLFTTLNRYAKPVNKKEAIALDEDDVIAIVTRELVDSHPLFRGKTAIAGASSIPRGDVRSFTNILTLYDSLNDYLREGSPREWGRLKRTRPEEDQILRFHSRAVELWATLTRHFDPLLEMERSQPEADLAGRHRSREGGHLLFRPIGLMAVIRTIRVLMDDGLSLDTAASRISRVPMYLAEEPWVGLLWDPTNRRILYAGENQKAAKHLLYYAVGGDLARVNMTEDRLRTGLAGLLNRPVEEIQLPRFVQ